MPSTYETATNEIVPAIRSYLAKELVNKHKMSQEKVAELLNVAQAAVSKYINGNYSDRVKGIEEKLSRKVLDKYVERIAQGEEEYVNPCICKMCQTIKSFDCAFSSAENIKV
ncbi:MAG: helix-turn-helix domain-containing protein [Candidatus Micrarchaeota archaeon]|nr:helix-turn-helix domain-containing protein [Candidatus Micrarchaeota archaeon]MDE1864945.1 helix-turn-helix domain-containing protein [Candidatus Micrarchaeota archaeon]